jgi:pantetheine-phosphate adenylyltransferase
VRTKKRLGVYAGSFDPLTVGHLWMIEQGVTLFDRLIVAIGINPDKHYTFSLGERLDMLRESLKQYRNLSVTSFSNRYLIDYAQLIRATHILRGIRSASDYEFERTMRNINGDLDSRICSVFLIPPPQHRRGQLEHGEGFGRAEGLAKGGAQIRARSRIPPLAEAARMTWPGLNRWRALLHAAGERGSVRTIDNNRQQNCLAAQTDPFTVAGKQQRR